MVTGNGETNVGRIVKKIKEYLLCTGYDSKAIFIHISKTAGRYTGIYQTMVLINTSCF